MVDDDDDNEREFCERSMMFERAPIPDPPSTAIQPSSYLPQAGLSMYPETSVSNGPPPVPRTTISKLFFELSEYVAIADIKMVGVSPKGPKGDDSDEDENS